MALFFHSDEVDHLISFREAVAIVENASLDTASVAYGTLERLWYLGLALLALSWWYARNLVRSRPGRAMQQVHDRALLIPRPRVVIGIPSGVTEVEKRAVRDAATLGSTEAREQNVIDIVARNIDELLDQADGMTVTVRDDERTLSTEGLVVESLDPDLRTRILATITNPNVALILMMVGIYGLIFEFINPGSLYPGTIGAISLLLGLYALAALPLNYAALGLIILGIALMVAEAFAPSFGILGIGGVIAFIIGAAMLLDPGVPGFEIAWEVIGGVAAVTLAFTLIVMRLAIGAHGRPVAVGREHMIGTRAKVLQDWSGTSGHVMAVGERWEAVSAVPLEPGQAVRVAGMDGLTLSVEPETERKS
jgi:membrane-bound serine protease (ClpP class)